MNINKVYELMIVVVSSQVAATTLRGELLSRFLSLISFMQTQGWILYLEYVICYTFNLFTHIYYKKIEDEQVI